MKRVEWSKYTPHPSITLILGGRGSGKTATACAMLDFWHKKKKDCYVVDGKHYPRWVKRTNINNLDKPDSVILIDDAHLTLYAREWGKKEERETRKTMDYLARQSRHKDISFIITTQQARVVDINVVSMVDCLIIKTPSLLQAEFERKELKQIFEEARVQLKGKSKKYAWVIYKKGKTLVGPYDTPKWFTKDISKGFRETKLNPKPKKKGANIFIEIVKAIGRL